MLNKDMAVDEERPGMRYIHSLTIIVARLDRYQRACISGDVLTLKLQYK